MLESAPFPLQPNPFPCTQPKAIPLPTPNTLPTTDFPAKTIVATLFIGAFFGYLNDTLLNVALTPKEQPVRCR